MHVKAEYLISLEKPSKELPKTPSIITLPDMKKRSIRLNKIKTIFLGILSRESQNEINKTKNKERIIPCSNWNNKLIKNKMIEIQYIFIFLI